VVNPNPFGFFREECENALLAVLGKVYPDFEAPKYLTTIPSSPQFGELSSSLCFELSQKTGLKSSVIAENLRVELSKLSFNLVAKVEAVGGYLNFFADIPQLASLTFEAVKELGRSYGLVTAASSEKILVEHTSANPSGPLHIGTARNAILGDALARLLEGRGHVVRRHFYVNDMGRQVATVAYGFMLLGKPKVEGKPDEWLGFLYTAVHTLVEITSLKKRMGAVKERVEAEKLKRQLGELVAIASELESQRKEVFDRLLEAVNADSDPEKSIEKILKLYEDGDPRTVKLIRRIVNLCLRGFRKTLKTAGIKFDAWDWESNLVWSGEVKEVLEKLKKTPYVKLQRGALTFDARLAAETLGAATLTSQEGLPEVSPLVLVRGDGTTLYTTRDIAYHLKKFSWADRAVNVIGVDQKLAQLQLKLALLALKVSKAADSLIHCAYELVTLPGYKMSRRRGRYVTFDEVMREAFAMAYKEVEKRSPDMSERRKKETAKAVGLGAIKYAMLSVSPLKVVTFSWDRVLNLEANSGPYIQYAHARACSILRKAGALPPPPPRDSLLLDNPLEKQLLVKLARLPEVFSEAADSLKPEILAEYANEVADSFNAFYDELPVLKAESKTAKKSRMWLVKAVQVVLGNSLRLLGIKAPFRM
jgi:arginyl-tRNA synthetase